MIWEDGPVRVLFGDVRERLRDLSDGSVHCVVTSPPYWGLRDYGTGQWAGGDPDCDHVARRLTAGDGLAALGERYRGGGHKAAAGKEVAFRDVCGRCGAVRSDAQIGLEETPEEYVDALVGVFREVRRVLRSDGTVWLNLGDSYASEVKGSGGSGRSRLGPTGDLQNIDFQKMEPRRFTHGLKPKDLVMVPARVALALQADGWYLRADVCWQKPNPMPESVGDRPTSSHEHVFLLARSPRYFYDSEAVREPALWPDGPNSPESISSPYGQGFTRRTGRPVVEESRKALTGPTHERQRSLVHRSAVPGGQDMRSDPRAGRNLRDVWTIATTPYAEAHFATYPEELVRRCVVAGTSERGCCAKCGEPWARVEELGWRPGCGHGPSRVAPCVVLDPFAGSGTTLAVARRMGRRAVGVELQEAYLPLIQRRVGSAALPLLELLAAEATG